MRVVGLMIVMAVVAVTRSEGTVKPVACPSGRFQIYGPPLAVTGANGSDYLAMAGTLISTTGGCVPTDGKVRAMRKTTNISVKWPACGPYPGPHRLTAKIDAATCQTITGSFKMYHVRGRRLFSGLRAAPLDCTTANQATFDVVQKRIFSTHGCNVSTCHGTFTQANLDLRDGAAYGAIVDVPASNATAAAAGKKLVAPGDAANSFLSQKVHGTLAAGEGGQMPVVGGNLTQLELDLLDAWIDAGAPQTGIVPNAPCLPALQYVPAEALPLPPTGGQQIVFNGPTLYPGGEQEGCFWTPVPNTTDLEMSKIEYSLNPGTHHFALYPNRIANPPLNTWLLNDFGCFQEATYGASLSGAPQSGYWVDAYPAGDTRVLKAGTYLGINAHYHNDFDVPIQIKGWINLNPYSGTPLHHLQTLTSLDTTFNIHVPPFSQATQHGHFVNSGALPMSFTTLAGHMHKRGLHFTIWKSDGTKIYENFDWAHPLGMLFDPPLVVAPGDYLDYECLFDNGVTRPVKRDGFGAPIELQFGVTTDDEMCILPGVYYTD